MLCIRSIELKTESLYALSNISPFPSSPQSLETTVLFPGSISFTFFYHWFSSGTGLCQPFLPVFHNNFHRILCTFHFSFPYLFLASVFAFRCIEIKFLFFSKILTQKNLTVIRRWYPATTLLFGILWHCLGKVSIYVWSECFQLLALTVSYFQT